VKIVDPGHEYVLRSLDGDAPQRLVFVKRSGPGYPGNVGAHPGTTSQEVLRVLIERAAYVQNQIPCDETALVIGHLKSALYLLELRAARRHGRQLTAPLEEIVKGTTACLCCGHVGCSGCRHKAMPASLAPDPHARLRELAQEFSDQMGETVLLFVSPPPGREYAPQVAYWVAQSQASANEKAAPHEVFSPRKKEE
jgi:hypothetical protein